MAYSRTPSTQTLRSSPVRPYALIQLGLKSLLSATDKPWHAEGLEIDMVEPMKQWTVKYEGDLIHQKTKKVYKCKLETTFTSIIPYFDFDADMDAWSVAKAFAREPWSREYFDQVGRS